MNVETKKNNVPRAKSLSEWLLLNAIKNISSIVECYFIIIIFFFGSCITAILAVWLLLL